MIKVKGIIFQLQLILLLSNFITASQLGESFSITKSPSQALDDSLAILVNDGDLTAIRFAYESWPNFGHQFLKDLQPKGAKSLLRYNYNQHKVDWISQIPTSQLVLISALNIEHFFEMKPETCATFAEYLEAVSDVSFIPEPCQDYLLNHGTITAPGILKMPFEWIKKASDKFISQLYTDHLNNLSQTAFYILVSLEKCQNLQPIALNHLITDHWYQITCTCLSSVRSLEMVQIPGHIISGLTYDIFSLYNGPLHKETLQVMTAPQAKEYAGLIPENVRICHELDLTLLSSVAASAISPRCLLGYLLGDGHVKRPLGSKWNALQQPFEMFTEEMMCNVSAIAIEDYKSMPPEVIDKIFTSRMALTCLNKNPAYIESISGILSLNSRHYKILMDHSGETAGRFLLGAKSLPDDTFAFFVSSDYANLSGTVGYRPVYGDALLTTLSRHKNFNLLVQNFGQQSRSHYCESLKAKEHYLKRLWLREHADKNCWKALSFAIDDSLRSKAPELDRGEMSWPEFVRAYPARWQSISPKSLADLLRMESFCKAFKEIAPADFLQRQPKTVLKHLGGRCAVHLHKLITIEIMEKLADNAFRYFTTELIPHNFKISKLRPNQVVQLSKGLSPDGDPHLNVFESVTLGDLYEMDPSSLMKITEGHLRIIFRDRESFKTLYHSAIDLAFSREHQGLVQMALFMCNSLLSTNGRKELSCSEVYERYRDNAVISMWQILNAIDLRKFPYLKASLAQEPRELYSVVIRDSFTSHHHSSHPQKLPLIIDPLRGFDRTESISILVNRPDDFVNSKMEISLLGLVETGWLLKSWIDQLMIDIRDTVTTMISPSEPFVRKFSWRIGKEAAYMAGLVFGKALQKEVPLPFTFSDTFWKLLIDRNNVIIDEHYRESYKVERDELFIDLFQSFSINDDNGGAAFIPPFELDSLTFSTLETSSEFELPTITTQRLSTIDGLLQISNSQDFKDKFFIQLDNVIKEEFRVAVNHFFDGLNKLIDIKVASLVRSFSPLKGLFAAVNPTKENILKSIIFKDDLENTLVESLIPNYSISVADVVKSFILALTEKQLEKFLKIWTGLSVLPKDSKLDVCRLDPILPRPVIGEFVNDPQVNSLAGSSSDYSNALIASGGEYGYFLNTIYEIQRTMILHVSPQKTSHWLSSSSSHHYHNSVEKRQPLACMAFTRSKLLSVYPQSAKVLIHSLSLLVNASWTIFFNQNPTS